MKIVLDCNVIISAGLTNGNCRKVLLDVLENHTLYISENILIEYRDVISRPKFKNVYQYLYSLIEIICEVSKLTYAKKTNFSLPDKDDLIYLETAISSDADYLITGNIKDFPMKKYNKTSIITPKEFLNTANLCVQA